MVMENRWRDLAFLWSDEVGMPNPNCQSSKRACPIHSIFCQVQGLAVRSINCRAKGTGLSNEWLLSA